MNIKNTFNGNFKGEHFQCKIHATLSIQDLRDTFNGQNRGSSYYNSQTRTNSEIVPASHIPKTRSMAIFHSNMTLAQYASEAIQHTRKQFGVIFTKTYHMSHFQTL